MLDVRWSGRTLTASSIAQFLQRRDHSKHKGTAPELSTTEWFNGNEVRSALHLKAMRFGDRIVVGHSGNALEPQVGLPLKWRSGVDSDVVARYKSKKILTASPHGGSRILTRMTHPRR
jgi:hypothetical protein